MNTTTAASPKTTILQNAVHASGGKPICDPNAPCQPCARADLQVLISLPSVVAKEHADALKDAGHAWAPAFDAAFGALARQATTPVARLARPGFVYLYYPASQRWDVWQVLPQSLARKVLHQVNRDQYEKHQTGLADAPPPKVCARGAANIPAQLISIHNASTASAVWLAYSPRCWTPATLQRYADNPEVEVEGANGKRSKHKLRSLRGREINPAAILQGKDAPAGCLPLNQATLEQHLAEFCPRPAGAVAPVVWPSLGFQRAFAQAAHAMDADRFGKAADFERTVRHLEQALSPPADKQRYLNKTMVLMLPDADGVVQAHNDIRLATLQARQGWLAGDADAKGQNADPKRPWERQSLLHAGYIREWVKDKEKNTHQKRLDQGLYRSSYVISAFEYQQILAQEKRTGDTVNPPGTAYTKLPGEPERYRVTIPKPVIDKGIDDLATASAKSRIERYNSHLDQDKIKAANDRWRQQEEGWAALLEARDTDYVTWLRSPTLQATQRYDYDDAPAISTAQRSAEQLKTDALEAADRLEALALCYGGGACSKVSLAHLVAMFKKAETDKSHPMADALMGEFGIARIVEKILDPNEFGTKADLYDVILSTRAAWDEFHAAWASRREQAAAASGLLLQTAYQVTQHIKLTALLAQMEKGPGGKDLKALKAALAEATRLETLWVSAAGLAGYLEKLQRQYVVGVRWQAGSFANAPTVLHLDGPALDVEKRNTTGKRAQKAVRAVRGDLRPVLAQNTANLDATVMIVLDESQMQRIANARGEKMLKVVGPGIMGRPGQIVELPESMARAIVRQYNPINRLEAFKSGASAMNMAVLWLQWHAMMQSWDDIQKKGGTEQTDAVFSAVGALSGVLAVGVEIGALMLTPTAKATQGAPMAAVLAKLPSHFWLRFSAGLLLAAGSGLDAAVAWAKAAGREAQGDDDSANAYFAAGGLQFGGFISLTAGAYYAHRARVLEHYGQQAVMRLFGAAFAPVQLARVFTGVGLLLWIGGVGLGLYALYLEDDDNEIFLRRSYFGKGHPQLGKFTDLEHEVQSFGALHQGMRAELEWHDNWTQVDEFTARIKVFDPQPSYVVTATVEGFDAINGRAVGGPVFKGELPPLSVDRPTQKENAAHDWRYPDEAPTNSTKPVKPLPPGQVHSTSQRLKVPAGVKAVRLSFAVYPNRERGTLPIAKGELWLED